MTETNNHSDQMPSGEAQEAGSENEKPYLSLHSGLLKMGQEVGRMSVGHDASLEAVLAAARNNVTALGGDPRDIDEDALFKALYIAQGAAGGLAQLNGEIPPRPES
jgi:hypothetical protein